MTEDDIQNLMDGYVDSLAMKYQSMGETQVEWSQVDAKTGKAVIEEKGLKIENKDGKEPVLSVAEFAFDPQDSAFEFGLRFTETKAEESKYVGLVFDYHNNRNFKAIVVSRKNYIYYAMENGEASVIKTGLVKPGKTIETITIKRNESNLDLILNGMEVATLKHVVMTSTVMGVIVVDKFKAICSGYMFNVFDTEQDDTEQSTSDV